MLRLRYVAMAILPLLFCRAVGLAQPEDDNGALYFPPKLTVSYQFGSGQPTLGITESISPSSMVLLPVIFFDHPGDWAIPSRYQIFTGSFSARDYTDTNSVRFWDPLGKYREILNIIGFRMQEHPTATIKLQGGYSTEPGEDPEVGAARAEIVREYLTNVWHIAPERVGLLPPQRMCDSSEHLFRQQEARRVTIVSNDWEILKPVKYTISIRGIGSLYMRFTIDPYAQTEDVQEIEFVMTTGDKIIGQAVIPGHPDSALYRVTAGWWKEGSHLDQDQSLLDDLAFSSISIDAYVRLRDGRTRRSNTERIDVRTTRYESGGIDGMPNSLTLPFFAYRDSALTDYQRVLIDTFMANQPSDGSLAMDLMGRADYSEDPQMDAALLSEYDEMSAGEYIPMEDASARFGQLTIWSPGAEDNYEEVYQEEDYIEEESEYSDSETGTSEEGEFEEIEGHFTSDSLAMARTRVVERYFRDSLKINLSTFDQLPGRSRGVASTYEYLPEERWLARSVVLVAYPYQRFAEQQEWLVKELKRQESEEE